MNESQFKAIFPKAPQSYFLPLSAAMKEFKINTPQRQAAFVAQVAHESGGLKWFKELWGPTEAQLKYEGRRALGNLQPGDGKKYRGRGPIQITGRANYDRFGKFLNIDLINNPELAEQPIVGFRIAACFWDINGCNELADGNNFTRITRVINGGLNGHPDRCKWYELTKKTLCHS